MSTHILSINCTDEKGLISKITQVIYKFQLNIISNEEFVERELNQFFMRTEFSGEFDGQEFLKNIYSVLPAEAIVQLTANEKKNVVVMVSKEYHCLGDLLMRHKFDDLHANIVGVISNHAHLEELVKKFDLPFYHIAIEQMSREEHEGEILKVINHFAPDFIVLAKYMRILSPAFITAFRNRLINIHHSFLPAFVGAKPYHKAYERGVKIIGATAHFVNENLDEGPIIAQNVISVDHSHSATEMTQLGRDVEKAVLAKSLKLVFNEKVFVFQNKTIIFD